MPEIEDGESVEVQGSAAKPYVLTNIGGVYSCSCPAWRNQSTGIERRTCKHLRKYRGDQAEEDRLGGQLPVKAVRQAADNTDGVEGPPVLLAHAWDNTEDLTGWWISEKLDGVRAYWDGAKFVSRQGNEFMAPKWFVDGLPNTPLDGELWLDRRAFQKTISIVCRQDRGEQWKQIRYLIFDAPAEKTVFEERIQGLKDQISAGLPFAELLNHSRCENLQHLRSELARIESLGGEGLMLREPGSKYEVGRSTTLFKVKTFHDAEAVVIDHLGGKGRHKGRTGALVVRLPDGTEFSVGTGLSDRERENPPKVGSTITFRFQELTDGGVPRFPSFVRAADDKCEARGANDPSGETSHSSADVPLKRGSRPASTSLPVPESPSVSAKGKRTVSGKQTGAETNRNISTPDAVEDADSVAAIGAGYVRYFEFADGKSNKFWEIRIVGTEVTVRYGRIESAGTTNMKSFATDEAASNYASKLIDEKTEKGYLEK